MRRPAQHPWLQSWWVALTLAPFGLLAWLAFLYAAWRAGMPRWLLAAALYLAALIAGIALANGAQTVGVGSVLLLAVWIVPLVHALRIRRRFLERIGAPETGAAVLVDRAAPGLGRGRLTAGRPRRWVAWLLGLWVALCYGAFLILAIFFLVQGVQGLLVSSGRQGYPGTLVLTHCSSSGRGGTSCQGLFIPAPGVADLAAFPPALQRDYGDAGPGDHAGELLPARVASPTSGEAWVVGSHSWLGSLAAGLLFAVVVVAMPVGLLRSRRPAGAVARLRRP